MYSSFHSSVAIGIMLLPIPMEVKIPLAIASHLPVDMLGEGYIGNKWVEKEIFAHLAILVVALLTGSEILALIGILSGNLIDIIDKVFMRRLIGKELIHESKWYPQVIYYFSNETTQIMNYLSVAFICILFSII